MRLRAIRGFFISNPLWSYLNPTNVFIAWGIYLLLVVNFGYFYNFELLNHIFLPFLALTFLSLGRFAYLFVVEIFREVNTASKLLLITTFFVISYIIKMSLFFPDYSWDGQSYHLPTSVEWSKTGKIGLVYLSLYSSTYPGLSELLQALWFRSANLSGPPHNISQIIGYVILSFSIVGIARTLNWKLTSQIFILIFSLTIPNVVLQSTTAYNDLFFNSLIIAGLYFVLNFAKSEKPIKTPSLYGVGIAAGFIASTKFTGAYYAVALYVLLLILGVKLVRLRLAHLIFSILMGIAICLPWYFRNLVSFGNPFYPLSVGIGDWQLFVGLLGTPDKAFFDHFSEQVGIQNSPIGVVRSWFWWPIDQPVYDTRVGGSGIAWLGIIVLTLFAMAQMRAIKITLAFKIKSAEKAMIVFALLSIFIVPAGWWPRYVLFFPIIIGSILLNWILNYSPKFQKYVIILLFSTIIESMFYLSFYAGSPTQSYLYYSDKTIVQKSIHSSFDTLIQTKRKNVYELVSRELSPLADVPASNVYVSDAGAQFFPLYGINFQHNVLPAFFTKDRAIFLPSLLGQKIGSIGELSSTMKLDKKPSIFVSQDKELFARVILESDNCFDISLKPTRTFIASCK
jgi:hypothetical protein